VNENIFNAILNVSSEMCPANAVQQEESSIQDTTV